MFLWELISHLFSFVNLLCVVLALKFLVFFAFFSENKFYKIMIREDATLRFYEGEENAGQGQELWHLRVSGTCQEGIFAGLLMLYWP